MPAPGNRDSAEAHAESGVDIAATRREWDGSGRNRPTKQIGKHRPWSPFERSGRHWWVWIAYGTVACQVAVRVWRFTFATTFWRSYEID